MTQPSPQKTIPTHPLTDRFGRAHSYLRISVTDRCNLRCLYCMPHEGIEFKPHGELLTYEEILRLSSVFTQLGVNKIRITGGEPLVRKDLPFLIQQLHQQNSLKLLAMTSNGILLKDYAQTLKDSGLNGINISLDTLDENKFAKITQRGHFKQVLSGIDAALNTGFDTIKINVVVVSGLNDDEILNFVHFVKDKPLNVRFIEYMPFKNNQWTQGNMIPYAEVKRTIETHYALEPIQTEPSAVAKDYALVGHTGTVSFISSMSDSFCGTCNRLRLTADGHVKSCLFHASEIALKGPLRDGASDKEIVELIQQAVLLKQEAHEPMGTLEKMDNRPMIAIGG